jgi:endo-beta-N-acetylglucosaminidase D
MMQNYLRKCLPLLALLCATLAAHAQLEPAAQYTKLSVAQLMAWTPTGPTATPANVSQVPLATRQNDLSPQLNPAQSFSAKVNYIPDGMANFAGYLNEQNHFNLYNFTHWQYIDVLTWFDGPVGVPCRPWVETAHRNGVKVIGTVFTSAADVTALIQKDANNNYIAAQKLVDMANYYGFDGWFFNEESSVSSATAVEVRNLLKRLQVIKPAGMEIHWYDAMLPGGTVAYQNALNANNQGLLQENTTRVSDAMFTNYFWSGPNNINTSVTTANNIGRSPFDVYMGGDLWPNRSNQSLFTNSAWVDNYYTNGNLTQPKLSFGLFAANLTYNGGFNNFNSDPTDYVNFYRTEQRIFAGNDLDVTTTDATGWKGFGYYLPVRSTINSLPFNTYFSVGQGKNFANNGEQVARSWTDMAKQSFMPSWQWAKTGVARITAEFDFTRAYYAGNSIKFAGSLSGLNSADLKIYQTKIAVTAPTSCDLTYKMGVAGASNTKLALYFSDNLAVPELLDLPAVTDTLWHTNTFSLAAYAGRELAIIGVRAISTTAAPTYRLNLGRLNMYNGAAVTTRPTVGFTTDYTTVLTTQPVTFANTSTNATSYTWTFAGGSPATSTAVHPTVSYTTPGTYAVKLRAQNAIGRDSVTRVGYITVVAAPPVGGNTALLFDGTGKYVDAGSITLSNSPFSLECWVKANSFKTGSPFISSIIGIEDGSNVAQIRLGDAGITADRLQFVANLGGAIRKLAANTLLTTGTWYHIAATYDGAGSGATMRLYINGVLDASMTAGGNAIASGNFAMARNYASSRCLDGSIDEVRVWKRALTAAEILANRCDVPPTSANLEAYWKFNEATGTTTQDLTGHGHLGTLMAMSPSDWSANVPTQCATVTATLPGRRATDLQLLVYGNPVPGQAAEIEIRGAAGQPVQLQLFNSLGGLVSTREVSAANGQRIMLPLPAAAGMYVLQARSATGSVSAKLLKP